MTYRISLRTAYALGNEDDDDAIHKRWRDLTAADVPQVLGGLRSSSDRQSRDHAEDVESFCTGYQAELAAGLTLGACVEQRQRELGER